MKYIIIISLIFLAPAAEAQFGKKLADRAKEAAERKANQKADEALNKGVDKIDSVFTGKKREKTFDPYRYQSGYQSCECFY